MLPRYSNTIDLYYLGIRESASITEQDWYAGESGGDEHGELVQAAFYGPDAASTTPSASVGAQLGRAYEEYAAMGVSTPMFAAFRLNFPTDFGCSTACDGGCSLRRVYIDTFATTFKAMGTPDVVDGDTGMVTADHQSELLTATCGDDGTIALEYAADEQGNTLIDFSTVGYRGGADLPLGSEPTVTVEPVTDEASCITTLADEGGYVYGCDVDDSARVQAAIDYVSSLDLDAETGYRGTVRLAAGEFFLATTLSIDASGVVLQGAGEARTTVWSTAQVYGQNVVEAGVGHSARMSEVDGTRQALTDAYTPVGATTLRLDSTGYAVGDAIVVERVATEEWIHSIGMDAIPNCESVDFRDDPLCYDWEANGYYDMKFERTVVEVLDDGLVIDHPIVHPISSEWGGGAVYKVEWSDGGRFENIGVEAMTFKSVYEQEGGTQTYEGEEDHAYSMVHMDYVQNGWVSDVSCYHQVFACVAMWTNTYATTVQYSSAFDSVSVCTGGRRYSFSLEGQLSLMYRNYARYGRHDYVTGGNVLGPNAWVDCFAEHAYEDIGPHMRYATGQLYDRVVGGQMRAWDRGNMGSGHGWSGAEIMFWNVFIGESDHAENLVLESPPGTRNYAIGAIISRESPVATVTDDRETVDPGFVESLQMHVFPSSLYAAQKSARDGSQYFECAAPEPDVVYESVEVDVEHDYVKFTYGADMRVGGISSTAQLGSGGSASSCTRSINQLVYFIEMGPAYEHVTDLYATFLISDGSKTRGMVVDLYGLGLRDDADATGDDFYIGTDDAANTKLAEALIVEGTTDTVTVNLGDYARTMYAEWAALGVSSNKALAFRLSQQDYGGCDTACDASCSIARAFLTKAGTTFTATYEQQDAEHVSDVSDGGVNTASGSLILIICLSVLGCLIALVIAHQAYKQNLAKTTRAATKANKDATLDVEQTNDKAGPVNNML